MTSGAKIKQEKIYTYGASGVSLKYVANAPLAVVSSKPI